MALFHELCATGGLEGVRALLAQGEDINAGNEDDWTGLMIALFNRHNSVVELLLQQASQDINRSDNYGTTAIHYASASDNVTGLRMLLGDPRLTSVNARNQLGRTPLMVAVREGSLECVRELVRVEGVDLETRDGEGRSLDEVARWVKCRAIFGTNKIPLVSGHQRSNTAPIFDYWVLSVCHVGGTFWYILIFLDMLGYIKVCGEYIRVCYGLLWYALKYAYSASEYMLYKALISGLKIGQIYWKSCN